MKISKLSSIAVAAVLVLSVAAALVPQQRARALGPNLVPNPSMEQANADNTAPLHWTKNKWGTNAATFQYRSDGHEGTRSVRVNMTAYTNGDAKWHFQPVTVTPGATYTFSEAYKANAGTSIVARSIDANGVESYFDVDVDVPASSTTWQVITYNVQAPANSTQLTLLHIIKKVGWLQVDSASLNDQAGTTPPPAPVPTNSILNPSVETVSANDTNLPEHWGNNQWGTNSPTFTYMKTGGHGDSKSVRIIMRNYQSGDAKWLPAPQPLTKGIDYKFDMWYKTNTAPHVAVQYTRADGSVYYAGLPDPLPAAHTNWQRYTDNFTVPLDAEGVSVFMFISSNGWLQTDDYNLLPATPTGFDRGIVTLTFDDGFEENVTTALPVLDQYGFKTTYCFATQYVEGIPEAIAAVQTIAAGGHEVCSHSVTHPALTTLAPAAVDYELSHSQQYLQSISGQPVRTFTTPFGNYNASVNNQIMQYYASHRTTDEGYNTKDNLEPYRLRVQNMKPTTTLAEFQGWVNKAKADKAWLVLVYHAVTTNPALLTEAEYNTHQDDFNAQMAWLATSGLDVVRWDQALAEVTAQQ